MKKMNRIFASLYLWFFIFLMLFEGVKIFYWSDKLPIQEQDVLLIGYMHEDNTPSQIEKKEIKWKTLYALNTLTPNTVKDYNVNHKST